MSKLRYYYYDHEACTFVEVKPDRKQTVRHVAISFVLAVCVVAAAAWGLSRHFGTPEELALREENRVLRNHLEKTVDRMEEISVHLDELAQTDQELYRTILGEEHIAVDVRQVGVGGVDLYDEFRKYSPDARTLLRQTAETSDKLERQARFQAASYRELLSEAERRGEVLRELPSILPTTGRLVSGFGSRFHPILKIRRNHPGIDLVVDRGTEIAVTGDGVVSFVGRRGGYGTTVEVRHPRSGHMTRYAHLSKALVERGDRVERGDIIALSGNTGLSAGPHLHYEVRTLRGEALNPIEFIAPSMTPQEFQRLKEEAENAVSPLD